MINTAMVKLGGAALAAALIFGTGWHFRGLVADSDMSAYKIQLAEDERKAQAEIELKRQADAKNLTDSSTRVDTVTEQHRVEVQYVDREVIKYRDRPVAGKCVLPAEWVRLYNRSGRATDVPSAANP